MKKAMPDLTKPKEFYREEAKVAKKKPFRNLRVLRAFAVRKMDFE